MIKLLAARLKNKVGRRFTHTSRRMDDYAYGSGGSTVKRAYRRRMAVSDDLKRQAAFFFAFLAVGSVIGAIIASMLGYSNFSELFRNVYAYLGGGLTAGTASNTIVEGLIKHGKIIVCIWLLGFAPRFAFLSLFVVLTQGIGIGFTTAILTRGFGIDGILYAAMLYLPQNLFLIPAYFYVTAAALKRGKHYSNNKGLRVPPAMTGISAHNDVGATSTLEYTLRLVPALAVMVVVSCFEWAITPVLLGFVA